MTRNAHHDNIAVPATTTSRTRRHSRLERWGATLVGGVVIVHGAVHLLGAAKGLGWADVPALAQPITAVAGAGWLLAAVVTVAAGSPVPRFGALVVDGGSGSGRAVPGHDRARLERRGRRHRAERGPRRRGDLRLRRARPDQLRKRIPTPRR